MTYVFLHMKSLYCHFSRVKNTSLLSALQWALVWAVRGVQSVANATICILDRVLVCVAIKLSIVEI